jgi:hypothetical protein
MIIIAHRGNIGGSDPEIENHPKQIDRCIAGYQFSVEIDLWKREDGTLALGHDWPEHDVNIHWLHMRSNFLWIHCKNIQALSHLQTNPFRDDFNFFWHENDDYTLTSKGYIWTYPGKEIPYPSRAIAVMPEFNDHDYHDVRTFNGVCTDFPERYQT